MTPRRPVPHPVLMIAYAVVCGERIAVVDEFLLACHSGREMCFTLKQRAQAVLMRAADHGIAREVMG